MIKYTHEPKHYILLASASDQEENVENQILDMQRMNSASPSNDHQGVGGNNCTLLLQRATRQILLQLPHFTMVKCCTSRQLQQNPPCFGRKQVALVAHSLHGRQRLFPAKRCEQCGTNDRFRSKSCWLQHLQQ